MAEAKGFKDRLTGTIYALKDATAREGVATNAAVIEALAATVPTVDADLDTAGAAADAKAVGDAIADAQQDIDNVTGTLHGVLNLTEENLIPYATTSNMYIDKNGVSHTSNNWTAYQFTAENIAYLSKIITGTTDHADYMQLSFYSSNTIAANTFISGVQFGAANAQHTIDVPAIPSNAVTIIITNRSATYSDLTIMGKTAQNIVRDLAQAQEDIDGLETALGQISDTKTYTVTDTLDNVTFTEGGYVNKNGSVQTNSSYKYTNKISCNAGDVITDSSGYFRFICAYSGDTVVSSAGSDSAVTSYTVPDGVDGVIISGLASGESTLKNLTRTYSVTEHTTVGADEGKIAYSSCGNNGVKATSASLASGTALELTAFPYYLKKGVSISFFGKFASFTSLKIGKGYDQYRGSWFEIDDTNIVSKYCTDSEGTETTVKTTAHNMTFSGFVGATITVDSDNDAAVHLALNTMGGSKTFDFDWSHEFNDVPFVIGGQAMTDVILSATANDAKCPMWLFGDSYFGVASNRIIGQLINLGYAEGVLIDGRAGNNATHAYADFTKLINMGAIPKYLVWCIGMNGNAYDNIEKATALKELAAKYGFELILYKIPTVAERDDENNATNTGYLALDTRIVDAKTAVGASDAGIWYTDYLSSDGIHPTVLGAQAIAMRICIDVPELMQYGYHQGQIGDSISGDI